jgi:hypothetical protein
MKKYRRLLFLGIMSLLNLSGGISFAYNLPDTNVTIRYSTATGDDSYYHDDYNQPLFEIINSSGSLVTYHHNTGLIWLTTIAYSTNWENAIITCENLDLGGYSDWRLPNIRELMTIVDYSRKNVSVNPTYFINVNPSPLWTNTTYKGTTADAWYVNFDGGNSQWASKLASNHYRCLRGPDHKPGIPQGGTQDMNIISISTNAVMAVGPTETGIGIVSFLFGALIFSIFLIGLRLGKNI